MEIKLDKTICIINAWGSYICWFLIRNSDPFYGLVLFSMSVLFFIYSIFSKDTIDAKEVIIVNEKNKEPAIEVK
jgi:hypothetical protein